MLNTHGTKRLPKGLRKMLNVQQRQFTRGILEIGRTPKSIEAFCLEVKRLKYFDPQRGLKRNSVKIRDKHMGRYIGERDLVRFLDIFKRFMTSGNIEEQAMTMLSFLELHDAFEYDFLQLFRGRFEALAVELNKVLVFKEDDFEVKELIA